MTQDECIKIMREYGHARTSLSHQYATDCNKHSDTSYGLILIQAIMPDIKDGISQDMQNKRYGWIPVIADVGIHKFCSSIIRSCVDNMYKPLPYADMVKKSAYAIDDYMRIRYIKKNIYGGRRMIEGMKFARHKSAYLRDKIATGRRKKDIQFTLFERKALYSAVHTVLFRVVAHPSSPVVDFKTKVGKHYQRFITTKKGVTEWVKEERIEESKRRQFNLPMVVPPLEWTSMHEGGYGGGLQSSFIKAYRREYMDFLAGRDFSNFKQAAEAANHLQSHSHELNHHVFDAFSEMYDLRVNNDLFPCWEDMDYGNVQREDKEAAKIYFKVGNINKERKRWRMKLATTKRISTIYKDEKFYLPVKSDHRGRLYPMSSALNYQASNLSKSLFLFGEGKACNDPNTEKWLKIHVANVCGQSKLKFADRVSWVDNNLDIIKRIAESPIDTVNEWKDFSDPWQSVAACKEYMSYLDDPVNHVHKLPIGMDASCNGLQILSVLAGCEDGCIKTNVLPNEDGERMDFYTYVRYELERLLKKSRNEYADKWLVFGINRACVKRPTMTIPYGGTNFTRMNGIREWHDEELSNKTSPFDDCELGKAIAYLAKEMIKAITNCIPNVMWVVDWLKDVVREAANQNIHAEWRSPSDFLVTQIATKRLNKSIYLHMYCKVIVGDYTKAIDKRKSANAIVPNFIQCIDAAVLHTFANKAKADPFLKDAPISTVHDCFNTTAPYAEAMNKMLRETFREVMSKPLLENFLNDMKSLGVKNLPDVPKHDELPLHKVSNSIYLFS